MQDASLALYKAKAVGKKCCRPPYVMHLAR
jgi:hypothetical protein